MNNIVGYIEFHWKTIDTTHTKKKKLEKKMNEPKGMAGKERIESNRIEDPKQQAGKQLLLRTGIATSSE